MRKKEGFPGQQSYVIPEGILKVVRQSPFCSDLYLTDIGYYPLASHHFRERKEGIDQHILIYNIEGSGSIGSMGRGLRLPADHFVMIPAGVPHAYAADKQDPWSIYWIHFAGPKAGFLALPGLQPVAVTRSGVSRISERLNIFAEIFRTLERGFSIENLEYANLCLPRLIATFTHLAQYRSVNEQLTKDPISKAINIMLEHISGKFRLEDLAHAVKLSPSHFSRQFQARTGHSPIRYFIQLKIQRSCQLLDSQDLSVADVARETGFEDQFYFSRQFRKVMNMSPTEYRSR